MKLKSHSRLMGLVQGGMFLVVGALVSTLLFFDSFETEGSVGADTFFVYVVLAMFFSGIIAAVSGINTARKDYLEGKIEISDAEREQAKSFPPPRKPMWAVPLAHSLASLAIFTAIAAIATFLLFPGGMNMLAVGVGGALLMGVNAFVVAARLSWRELLKYIAHPHAQAQAFGRYLFQEQILGNVLINLGINFGVGYILFHPSPGEPSPMVEASEFLPAYFVMSLVVALAVSVNASMQTADDVLEGGLKAPQFKSGKTPHIALRVIAYLLAGACLGGITWGIFATLGLTELHFTAAMTVKSALSAVVAAVGVTMAAYWSAKKTVSEHKQLAPETLESSEV